MGKEYKKTWTLFRISLRLQDYQSKPSRYRKGVNIFKKLGNHKSKKKKKRFKKTKQKTQHEIKGNHQTTKSKRKEQRRDIESTGKQGLKWQ